MIAKTTFVFLLFTSLSSSTGFHVPESCLKVNFGDLSSGLDMKNVMKTASCLVDILQQSETLKSRLQSTIQLLDSLAEHGAEKIFANPANAAGFVLTLAPIVLAYQQSRQANELLMKAQFEHDDLEIIVEAKVVALLEAMNKLRVEKGEANGVCKKKDGLKEMMEKIIEDLQRSRKRIEKMYMESSSGEFLNCILQRGCVAIGIASVFGFASAPLPSTAVFLGCALSYNMFERNIQTYKEAQEILWSSKDYAKEAEKSLTHALINVKVIC